MTQPHPPLTLGRVLRCNAEPRHFWFILSDPQANGGEFLFLNFTTFSEDSPEDECIVSPTEYRKLSRDSAVAFSRGIRGNVAALAGAIDRGDFMLLADPLPTAVLSRIIDAAHSSRQLSRAMKRLLPLA